MADKLFGRSQPLNLSMWADVSTNLISPNRLMSPRGITHEIDVDVGFEIYDILAPRGLANMLIMMLVTMLIMMLIMMLILSFAPFLIYNSIMMLIYMLISKLILMGRYRFRCRC